MDPLADIVESACTGPRVVHEASTVLEGGYGTVTLETAASCATSYEREPLDLSLRSGGLFAFAGLWAAWKQPDGEWLRSCTIVTTRPNQLVAEVHDRMPVILPAEAEDDWLEPGVSVEHALSLLEPYPADEMRSVAISPLVNNVRNEGPKLLSPA